MKTKVILSILLMSLYVATFAQEKEEKETFQQRMERLKKEVKWVNPDIREMVGLSHNILNSSAMGHEVGYAVWTPPGYTEETEKQYPVIYFLHGAGGNESRDAAGFSSWALKAIEQGLLPKVICVFPNGGMSGYRGEVEKMIIDELMPKIDADYRTVGKPQSRALAGFSMGGSGSVYMSIMHPELFCAAGSMGGGLRIKKDELDALLKLAVPTWKKNNYGFFLTNGDKDRPDAFKELAVTLDKENIKYEILVLPDTPHKLGLYYEQSAIKLLTFLSGHLKE